MTQTSNPVDDQLELSSGARDHAGASVAERSPSPAGWIPAAMPGGPVDCGPVDCGPCLESAEVASLPATQREGVRASRRRGSRDSAPQRSSRQVQAVVVHSGARDGYQVARALDERGLLSCLVTDLYWPADRAWARALAALLPAGVRSMLELRREVALGSRRVTSLGLRGGLTLALDKLPRLPFAWRRSVMRQTDAALGSYAGRRARQAGAVVVAYSYYGYHALGQARAPGMLFQLHPHPGSMRQILRAELALHPECAASLGREWELALPEEDFGRLVKETAMAAHTLAASTFTRDTLVEHGTPAETITVVPYGVDSLRFSPGPGPGSGLGPGLGLGLGSGLGPGLKSGSGSGLEERPATGALRLLFVGRINQRKGIKYLLEALRLLNDAGSAAGSAAPPVQLTICGRVVDDLALFAPFGAQVEIRPDVSHAELVEAYREADLFVFPSVGEGFGHVLLEALACGLPVLSTTATAAPDLIEEGVEGWVVAPGRPDLLAERILWAATHRAELAAMRPRARACAEQFTWARFRAGVAAAYERFVSGAPELSPAAGDLGEQGVREQEALEAERV